MKKLLVIALLLTSTAAMAQTASATATASPPVASTPAAPAAGAPPAQKEEKFDDRKAKALQHVGERLSELQQKQSCLQAATTPDAMKACFPNKGEHKGRQGGCDMEK